MSQGIQTRVSPIVGRSDTNALLQEGRSQAALSGSTMGLINHQISLNLLQNCEVERGVRAGEACSLKILAKHEALSWKHHIETMCFLLWLYRKN